MAIYASKLMCFLSGLALSGCAAWYPTTDADQSVPAVTPDGLMQELHDSPQERKSRTSGFIASTPWLIANEIEVLAQNADLDGKRLTIGQYDQKLPRIVPRIEEMTGLTVNLSSDLYLEPGGEFIAGGSGAGGATPSLTPSRVVQDTAATMLRGSSGSSRMLDPLQTPITVVSKNGTARELLDNIASQLAISWKYDAARKRVTFYRLRKESYQVFFPGLSNSDVELGGSTGEDSVIEQNASFEFDGGTWDEILEGMQSLLSPFGKATILRSTGTIVVVDTPESTEAVGEFVERINDIYGRQVYLQIRTASVTIDNTNDFNLTWNNILNTVNNGSIDLGLNSAGVPVNGVTNTLNVIRSATGANLALQMLAAKTNSTEVNEQTVTTISNQPASLKVLTETGFISGISQQDINATFSNVVSDVETDTVNAGFDATLVPRVVNESVLQLQVALELSGNLQLQSFDSTIVQTPTRDRNSVVQRAWLRSGETWVLAAFSSDKSSDTKQGTGSPEFWGLGGGTSKSKTKQVLLVLITPHIQHGLF